jgi:transcriptional regulator with XRE-family HTH domain
MNRDYRALIEELQRNLYKTGNQTNVGMLIRDARLKRYLTQGELAKGICSVSYLSKIESGQHENSNVYVQEIVQRLGLELSHHHTQDYSKTMHRAIQLLYQMDIQGMRNHRAEFKDPVVTAEWLVDFANRIACQEDASDTIVHLDKSRRDFNSLELHFYLILLSMYELSYYRTKSLKSAIEVLEMVPSENATLNMMNHWVRARYYILLGKYTVAGFFLSQLMSNYGTTINDYWKLNVLSSQLLMFGLANETQVATSLIDQANTIVGRSEWYEYATAFYLMQEEKYTKAMQLFLQAKETHFGPSMLGMIECSYRLGNVDRLREYHSVLLDQASGTLFEKIGYMFVLATENNSEKLKNYITHILQPQFGINSYDYYHSIAIEFVKDYFRSVSRYKKVDSLRVKR